MLKYLQKKISSLKRSLKRSKAKDAATASFILSAIQNKKPALVLKPLEAEELLVDFLKKKEEFEDKTYGQLKSFLNPEDIDQKIAIDVIIALYFFLKIQTGTGKILWPEPEPEEPEEPELPVISVKLVNDWRGADVDKFGGECQKKPTQQPKQLISEYIEGKRIMPGNTPYPGPWKNSRTPYLIEPMDNMSPSSPVQHTGVMKGAQLGFTAGCGENVIAYWIDEFPAEILYVTATESLLEKWATKRLDPLIDSCDFRDKIYDQSETKGSRKTGDKIFSKAYVGGNLDMASAQSASNLRSDSKRILIRDELSGAPLLLRSGEGSWIEVSAARLNAWGDRAKTMDYSTPAVFGSCPMNDIVEDGDYRRFEVPCPLCKKKQFLEFGDARTQYGLKPDTKAGQLKRVYYMCDHCHDAIFNHQKGFMLRNGVWVPTMKSSSPDLRTYQISSLYSPVGMLSWLKMWKKYEKSQDDPELLRSFTNLYLGLPFKESGSRPKLETLIELRGDRKAGQEKINNDILYITIGVDVQAGSKKDEKNPPRLELEVLGIGFGNRTWSLLYKRIEGEILDPFEGAWAELDEWAKDGGLIYTKKDGREMQVDLIFMDSSDGNSQSVVYAFTDQWDNTFPIKGVSALKKKKEEKGDEFGPANFKRFRAVSFGAGQIFYDISTNYYKTSLYNNLKIPRVPGIEQRPGFCDFPADYPESYFNMLRAESKRRDGSFHCPSGRRNEALDCRVYAICAGDVYLDAKVQDMRAIMKANGANPSEISQFTHRMMIDLMVEQNKRDAVKNSKN